MLTSPRVIFPSVPCVRSAAEVRPDEPFPGAWPPLPPASARLADLQGDGGPFRDPRDPRELPAAVPCPTHCTRNRLQTPPRWHRPYGLVATRHSSVPLLRGCRVRAEPRLQGRALIKAGVKGTLLQSLSCRLFSQHRGLLLRPTASWITFSACFFPVR